MTVETEMSQSRGLDGLPAELIDMIVVYVDPPSLGKLASTCRRLSEILRSSLSKAAKGYALANGKDYFRYLERYSGSYIRECPFICRFRRLTYRIELPRQPLADAIEDGKINAVKGFLDAGVSPDSHDVTGLSMLGLAIGFRHTQIVELLLERGARLEMYSLLPQPKMICIIPYCNLESLKLIADKVNLNHTCRNGGSVLHQAVRNDNPNVLEFLVEKYAHLLSLQDFEGETALFRVTQLWEDHDRQAAIVRILVEAGIDINVRNRRNETAFHNACSHGSYEVVRFLLERGIQTNIPGEGGMTELHYAARDNSPEVVKLLLSHDTFNVHVSTNNGKTPLHMAASRLTPDTFAVLLENGAILHLRDANGQTPVDIVKKIGRWSIERYLQYEDDV
ncbi:ankyrin repeat-containing domain protein [Aspergillus pseudonomiae]|uniref:Ankyrin repeat-containing domain protein n=1 Tax=Aspergillus pseudonomiae TaxID=1506151 RepID=A0A5N7CXN2_9EURO|nr:ankyrin repeat-containing domain protein [Aspergillus pseudonomiae]KAE8398950.1 ankyrin repeat-containing domain protein [Aspergillus pseudonomiae]